MKIIQALPIERTDVENGEPQSHADARDVHSERAQTSFDALRWIFAVAVILAHSFALLRLADPLEAYSGLRYDFGKLGVTGFFAISGYLITASWMRKPDPIRFVKARVLRIMPGFVTALLFSVLVAALVAALPLEFLFHLETWRWILRNALLIGASFGAKLQGAFPDNPLPQGANGSLWTLTFEIRCYAVVLFLGLLGIRRRKAAVLLSVVALTTIYFARIFFQSQQFSFQYLEVCLAFAMGALVMVSGFRVGGMIFAAALVVACTATILHWPGDRWFYAPLQLAIALGVLGIALSPWLTRLASTSGDYSYGLYVYAFPLQQLAIALLGTHATPWIVFILTLASVLPIAMLSWHFLEKPALSLADRPLKDIWQRKSLSAREVDIPVVKI